MYGCAQNYNCAAHGRRFFSISGRFNVNLARIVQNQGEVPIFTAYFPVIPDKSIEFHKKNRYA